MDTAYKRVLIIQDISCLGQCSATIAFPILSACGYETCILPTALLSAHTAFKDPYILQLADAMPQILSHWEREKIQFDAIYAGYLGSAKAVKLIKDRISEFLKPGGIFILDPVMGDNGKIYSGLDGEYQLSMKDLAEKADILIPNLTELAALSGRKWTEINDDHMVDSLLSASPQGCTVVTGVPFSEKETGFILSEGSGRHREYRHLKYERSFNGTGDLFASCFTAACLRGKSFYDAAAIAADLVCLSIRSTIDQPAHWYGLRFESVIPTLIQRLEVK